MENLSLDGNFTLSTAFVCNRGLETCLADGRATHVSGEVPGGGWGGRDIPWPSELVVRHGRLWPDKGQFKHTMPCPCRAPSMPVSKLLLKATAQHGRDTAL